MAASQNFSTIVWEYFNKFTKETHFMTFCFLISAYVFAVSLFVIKTIRFILLIQKFFLLFLEKN